MGIANGDVSHNAVLSDLDLGVGSLRQRAVYNRVGKTSGTMSLSEHRGVACGSQLNSFRYDDPIAQDTHTGYGGYFPSAASTNNYISGSQIVLSARYSGAGGPDGSSEHRTNFKVTEDGRYRCTGRVDWKGDSYYYNTYYKVCVVCCSNGYLQGIQTLPLNYDPGVYVGNGIRDLNETFDLTTSKAYGTLILYAVRLGGGDSSRPESVAKFSNFRIVKL